MSTKKQASLMALLPIFVLLATSIGFAIGTGNSKTIPAITFFALALGVALLMGKRPMVEKIDNFAKGASNPNVITVILIFLLAGAFSSVSTEAGAVSSVVNASLQILPPGILAGGLFVIACFISLAMGTSVGTIVALAPIALGIASQTTISEPFIIGTILGGAQFGNNLSIVSDTTIAATRLCNVEMADKFKVNFKIVLPAAVLTFVLVTAFSLNANSTIDVSELSFNIFKIIPYLLVLGGALMGMNVFSILAIGIGTSGFMGLLFGDFTVVGFLQAVGSGILKMGPLSLIVILITGIIALVDHNGGVQWIIDKVSKRAKNKRQALFNIGFLTMVLDLCVANNTVAIITSAPIAMQMTEEFDIDPRRTASILDIFAVGMQSYVPYGGVLLITAEVAGLSPYVIMPYIWYPALILISALIAIHFEFPKLKPQRTSEEAEKIYA
jgi:Na+/H+ antiporter NhaC